MKNTIALLFLAVLATGIFFGQTEIRSSDNPAYSKEQ